MRVIVTGANGFIGQRLVAGLIEKGALTDPDGMQSPISELVLVDRARPQVETNDMRLTIHEGDLREEAVLKEVVADGADTVFHLASTLTLEAEQDPQTGLVVNMLLPLRLLEALGKTAKMARFVYPSSIAVFGGPLPEAVGEHQARFPQTSQGTAKAMTELLINDYSRRGLVDGRSLRLPIVLLRPPGGPDSIAQRISDVVHALLDDDPVTVPFAQDTRLPVASAASVVENLLRLHDLPADHFGIGRSANQPCLSVTMGEIAQAVAQRSGAEPSATIAYETDGVMQALIGTWPSNMVSELPLDPPLRTDADVGAIIGDDPAA